MINLKIKETTQKIMNGFKIEEFKIVKKEDYLEFFEKDKYNIKELNYFENIEDSINELDCYYSFCNDKKIVFLDNPIKLLNTLKDFYNSFIMIAVTSFSVFSAALLSFNFILLFTYMRNKKNAIRS